MKADKEIRIAVIGAGVRGTSLARWVTSSDFGAKIIAVAEPDGEKRRSFAAEFNLIGSNQFTSWEQLVEKLTGCDAAIIATLDNQHSGPAVACLNNGWHILLEKPLADTLEDCKMIVKIQKERNKIVAVCHTLRFMAGFRKLRELLIEGSAGQLIHVEHMEAIGHMRFAHNYVRGRWAIEKNNTFLLIHKCSHDIDYINWLFEEPCISVSSFGSLKYFTPANAPAGSAERCTGGCSIVNTCPYSAVRIYVNGLLNEWPARDICTIHTREEHLKVVETGTPGLCVWHAGNDVVDHQVVMMEFAGGATATCTLTGYSSSNGRRIRVQGTRGEILFDEAGGTISVNRFDEKEPEIIKITTPGAYHPEDKEIVNEWLSSLVHSTAVTVDAGEALRTHAVVFAAEISRHEKRTVEMSELIGNQRIKQ
jgi:predicted dehydrogenase